MQYGNCERIKALANVEECLNRTMQYGNEEVKEKCRWKENEFKSYYVVWKLRIEDLPNLEKIV